MFYKESLQDDIDEISYEIHSLKCSGDCLYVWQIDLDESDNMCDTLSNLENIMSECDRIGDMAEALWKKLSKPVG